MHAPFLDSYVDPSVRQFRVIDYLNVSKYLLVHIQHTRSFRMMHMEASFCAKRFAGICWTNARFLLRNVNFFRMES